MDRRCTPAEIRNAYRALAKRHHPDLNPQSPEALSRSQELNTAHEILRDPARRRSYDRELEQSETPPSTARSAKIERNISQDVHLRIEEFLRGVSLQVRVNDPANPHGKEDYELLVPEGTAPGARFRLPRSEPFTGGFVNVRVRALPGYRFQVRGSDLRCELRITARRAADGGSEMLQGATGSMLRVPIPVGTARGAVVTMTGEGLPKPRGGRGDLLVRLRYSLPVQVTRVSGTK